MGALVHGLRYVTGVTTIHLIVQVTIMDTEVTTTGVIIEGAIMTILGSGMEERGTIIIAGKVGAEQGDGQQQSQDLQGGAGAEEGGGHELSPLHRGGGLTLDLRGIPERKAFHLG